MKRFLFAVAALMPLAGTSVAEDIVLGNWNIQTLVHQSDSVTVFPDDFIRKPNDFTDLGRWRDIVDGDVFFLQEISSPAALDDVFPVAAGWSHCLSGQYAVLEGLQSSGPVCTKEGGTPHLPTAAERQQFTAVAVRDQSGITLKDVRDYEALNVRSDDGGTIRDVRWGLDVTISRGGKDLRILVVHLKSGCFDDRVNFRLFTQDPATSPPTGPACDTLGRQMYPLHQWIKAREEAGEAWMVAGDFNWRLDLGGGNSQDEIWQALTAYSPNFQGVDRDSRPDILIMRSPYKEASTCWLEKRNAVPGALANQDEYFFAPIEFFLYGDGAEAMVVSGSGKQIPWPNAAPGDNERLSDHCPSSLTFRF